VDIAARQAGIEVGTKGGAIDVARGAVVDDPDILLDAPVKLPTRVARP